MSGEAAFLLAIFVSVLISGFLVWIVARGVDDAVKAIRCLTDTVEHDITILESRIKRLEDLVESKK